jgi:phosphomannomutase
MSKPMISVSGVRGIINDSFSEKLVQDWAKAFGIFCLEKRNMEPDTSIVIGRDSRRSGEWTENIIVEELEKVGVQPILVGIVPTPTVELAVTHHKADGGIIITASHNPMEWNGLKFLGPDGVFLDATEIEKLKLLASNTSQVTPPEQEIEEAVKDTDAIARHVEKVLSTLPIDVEKICAQKFKVVLDPVNGAGALAVPLLLEKLGCETTIINGEPSGIFGHTPEPRPENLIDLSNKVKEVGAIVGFAVDPDADRLALINEKGEAISEEYTLVLAILGARKINRDQNGTTGHTIAVNLSTSRMIDDVAEIFGAKVVRSAVGERNVVEEMRKNNSVIGGEGNGGVIFPACHEGRDSLVGIALILDLLAQEKKAISTIIEDLPNYIMEKIKIPLPPNFNPTEFGKNIKNVYPDAIVNNIDGIRVDTADGWVHVRASNTEPVFRIIAEAKTKQFLDKIISETKNLLK